MLVDAVFNQNASRPYRWSLKIVQQGKYMEHYWMEEDRYTHVTTKATPTVRDLMTKDADWSYASFKALRKKHIGFLTTQHREFYEDGKYTIAYNDPINGILANPTDYNDAFKIAEQYIGNYRMGVRRHIIHLGGTISDDELDMFKDSTGTALTSFPLVPPKPAAVGGTPYLYDKPFRTFLIASDVGYIDYIKAAHSSETTTSRYAYRSEQGTGFRRFVFNAGNTNMAYESASTPIVSVEKVEIKDIETVVNAAIDAQIDGTAALGTPTFLPADGEDILVNFPGWHLVRSNSTKYAIEMYDAADLGTLVAEMKLDRATGDINIISGSQAITMDRDGNLVITDGTRSITMNGTTVDIT